MFLSKRVTFAFELNLIVQANMRCSFENEDVFDIWSYLGIRCFRLSSVSVFVEFFHEIFILVFIGCLAFRRRAHVTLPDNFAKSKGNPTCFSNP